MNTSIFHAIATRKIIPEKSRYAHEGSRNSSKLFILRRLGKDDALIGYKTPFLGKMQIMCFDENTVLAWKTNLKTLATSEWLRISEIECDRKVAARLGFTGGGPRETRSNW
jgi:hypothetical protein